MTSFEIEEALPLKCLDHGYIRLVDFMGSDMSIVRSARVSYNAEPRNDGSDEKLIKFLMLNRHSTPLESVQFTFEVKAPIFVVRQWHRHRTQSYNEVSARYTELPEEFYVPELSEITQQSKQNKQMRVGEQHPNADIFQNAIRTQSAMSFDTYKALLAQGCPRELARLVLPMGTYTKMFASMNLHNLLHFIGLRDHDHAQPEIRVYAKAMLELIEPVVPLAVKYFKEIENHE